MRSEPERQAQSVDSGDARRKPYAEESARLAVTSSVVPARTLSADFATMHPP